MGVRRASGLVTWGHAELRLGHVAHLGATGVRRPHGWKSTIHISLLPVILAILLQCFLCHGLHKFRIVPGDHFRDRHSDGVGIKKLHHHLREARGDAGVRSVGAHLERQEVSGGLAHGPKQTHFFKSQAQIWRVGPFPFY